MGRDEQGLAVSAARFKVAPRVLVFPRHGRDVLLLKGAPDKLIWPRLYNGLGGHVEAGEDILSAARREAAEESGLYLTDMRLEAVVSVDAGEDGLGILLFVFSGWSAGRQMTASAEGALEWFAQDDLPVGSLVEDLSWLLPRILERPAGAAPLFLHYHYDPQHRLAIRPSAASG